MLNEASLAAVAQSRFGSRFSAPLHGSYCFSQIPQTVQTLLGCGEGGLPAAATRRKEPLDILFFFLIDGFGWSFFERYADSYPFLRRFIQEGTASKITSLFPSTTAVHVTNINTQLLPSQTGIYEWFYYEPKVDAVIAPLLFSFAGDKKVNSLEATGIRPAEIYPSRTIYHELQEKGVSSYACLQRSISDSPYSQMMFSGAQSLPYDHFDQLLDQLLLLPETCSGPTYVYVYFSEIDAMGHRKGLYTPPFEEAVASLWTLLEERFWKRLVPSQKKIGCIVTADHGMTAVDPAKTLYLNQAIPSLGDYLERNRKGKLIAPAGSCRDFFLHVKKESLHELQTLLRAYLQGRAEVHTTADLIEQGLFGPEIPSRRFLERVGNLVILPYEQEGIWWYEKHRFEQHFQAVHGGLTREEMESIFLFLEV